MYSDVICVLTKTHMADPHVVMLLLLPCNLAMIHACCLLEDTPHTKETPKSIHIDTASNQEMASNGRSYLISLPCAASANSSIGEICVAKSVSRPPATANSSFSNFCWKGNLQMSGLSKCLCFLTYSLERNS